MKWLITLTYLKAMYNNYKPLDFIDPATTNGDFKKLTKKITKIWHHYAARQVC